MELNELLVPGGMVTVVGGIVAKVVTKLYADMQTEMTRSRDESNKREERLMSYLEEKNKTDAKVAQTLEDISEKLQSVACRVDGLEGVAK